MAITKNCTQLGKLAQTHTVARTGRDRDSNLTVLGSQAPETDDHLPNDWCSFREFRKQFPNLHSSDESLRWELRFRALNGLIEDLVVIERRADPRASRPSILISPARYVSRLRRLARRGSA